MLPKRPLKRDELYKRLKKYHIEVLKKRGKGSEAILLQTDSPGSKKGETFPIKDHGKQTEHAIPVINAILRRFRIDPDDFWE